MIFPSARRYYLTKAFQAKQEEQPGLASAWQAKQEAEDGAALDASIPHQTDLAALRPSYTKTEDLAGSSVDELTTVGLPRSKARAVMDAVAALG